MEPGAVQLVMAHRLESGAFGYELLWNPSTAHGYNADGRFLAGLTDPAILLNGHSRTAYDSQPVGPKTPIYDYDDQPVGADPALAGPWSGPGRGVVGPRSHPKSESDDEKDAAPDVLRWAAGGGR